MHAADRWAHAITRAIQSDADPRTLAAWARAAGAGVGTIRAWCRAAGVSPRSSLYFCRMVRALVLSKSEGWQLHNLLDIVDERTLKGFLARCGVTSPPGTIEAFFAAQPLIADSRNVEAVRRALLR